jgi:hypothetical protein
MATQLVLRLNSELPIFVCESAYFVLILVRIVSVGRNDIIWNLDAEIPVTRFETVARTGLQSF